MAVGEARKQVTNGGVISQVSWTDGTAQDVYYGLEHSFQYSANINCDDEMHGIKLANKAIHTNNYSKCHLVSCGSLGVVALPLEGGDAVTMQCDGESFTQLNSLGTAYSGLDNILPGTIFQDKFWWGGGISGNGVLFAYTVTGTGQGTSQGYAPYDHNDYTNESISDESDISDSMEGPITAILNYNNTRLVVASGSSLRVYYPELDVQTSGTKGKTGWKKVLNYEAGVTIVGLTCTFEYLKVRAVDEGWNTKVYYYQGNNDLRSTFVYNIVDLTGERVLHVYSVNGTDYFTTSIDGTDGYVNLNKMIGNVAVQLFHQRAGLTEYDINTKAPYFVGPTSINAAYKSGRFYIADAYGVFQFRYDPTSYDRGYMKWLLSSTGRQVYGLCENKGFLYVSDSTGCWAMRLYDTGVDGYQTDGVLISREFEGKEGGSITKMLDEIRLNFELNPLTNNKGSIDIYVSPNNLRKSTEPDKYIDNGAVDSLSDLPDIEDYSEYDFFYVKNKSAYYMPEYDEEESEYVWTKQDSGIIPGGWYHVMHIDNTNGATRTEKSNLLNNLSGGDSSSFKFDWQTLTYAIVITRGDVEEVTPIVREIIIKYHCKDKVNNVYDIN